MQASSWLPPGKRAAVCFTIDDVHPGRSTDAYEAGGDLGDGALRHLEWLIERHPQLRTTLFVTADWRALNPAITRPLLAGIPRLRNRFYLTRVRPSGSMHLARHRRFVEYLTSLPGTDVALHGLHHIRKGPDPCVEFAGCSYAECHEKLAEIIAAFDQAGLPFSPGMCPPCWHLSPELAEAIAAHGLAFVASARDIRTPVTPEARTGMSGLHGVSLIYPTYIQNGKLLHLTSNFQASSAISRAIDIIECGGLLAIKAHIVKHAFRHTALDGLDELYRNYLDTIFLELERVYGDELWWTSMSDITAFAARAGIHPSEESTAFAVLAG